MATGYETSFRKIASKEGGLHLFRSEYGYFFESSLELDKATLSENAEIALSESGKLRQAYLSEESLNDYIIGDDVKVIEELISLIQPAVIRLWMLDRLVF